MSRRAAPAQAEAALDYAKRAYARAAPPWAAQAVLDDYAARGDWADALAAVEANAHGRLIDRPTANRWRAVLKTALAAGARRARRQGGAGARPARRSISRRASCPPRRLRAG